MTPSLQKVLPDLKFNFSVPTVTDAIFEATNNLADLLEHYGLDPMDFVQGQVKNFITGEIYQANSKLMANEALKVATAARKAEYLHGYVRYSRNKIRKTPNEHLKIV